MSKIIHTRILSFSFVFLCFLTVHAVVANAMVIRGGETYSLEDYSVLEDDLYVAAEQYVQLSGTTTGDVFAVSSKVVLDGVVGEDAVLAGGELSLSGNINGDARIAGGRVLLEGNITEDVILGGGSVEIRESAVIEGDLFVYADYVDFRGEVHGKVVMHGRLIDIKGDIYNDAEIHVSEALSVKNNASIEGDLFYEAPHKAFIPDESVITGKVHPEVSPVSVAQGSFNWMSAVFVILVAVILSTMLTFFFPGATKQMTSTVFKEKPMQVVKGTILLLFWPLASVILMFTVIGAPIGAVLLFAYIISVVVAMALSPVIAGVILARWLKYEKNEFALLWVAFGAVAFTFIMYVPVLGWLVRLLIFLFAFNAVCMLLYTVIWKNRKKDLLVEDECVQKKKEVVATETLESEDQKEKNKEEVTKSDEKE